MPNLALRPPECILRDFIDQKPIAGWRTAVGICENLRKLCTKEDYTLFLHATNSHAKRSKFPIFDPKDKVNRTARLQYVYAELYAGEQLRLRIEYAKSALRNLHLLVAQKRHAKRASGVFAHIRE